MTVDRERADDSGADLVWGINPVSALLEEDELRVHKLLVAEGRRDRRVEALLDRARERGVPVAFQPTRSLDRVTGGQAHQGVAARVAVFAYADLEEVLAGVRERGETPLLVALDGVEDPHNLGAIARSAAALGAHALLVPRHRSAAVGGTALKVSAGALARIPVCRVANLARSLKGLKEDGLWVLGTDPRGEVRLRDLDLDVPLVVVVGAEGQGMRPVIRSQCDWSAVIPMEEGQESLNASVAAGVVLYEVRRQRTD